MKIVSQNKFSSFFKTFQKPEEIFQMPLCILNKFRLIYNLFGLDIFVSPKLRELLNLET